jgi:glutaredoxin
LTLVTRTACHLCDDTAEALERLGVGFATIDVDTDAALVAAYGDAVPVLLLGDQELMRAPIDERRLRTALRGAGLTVGA